MNGDEENGKKKTRKKRKNAEDKMEEISKYFVQNQFNIGSIITVHFLNNKLLKLNNTYNKYSRLVC